MVKSLGNLRSRPVASMLAVVALFSGHIVATATPAVSDSGTCPTSVAPPQQGGAGSPFLLSTPGHLQFVRDNDSMWDEHLILTGDLNFSGCTWLTTIGNGSSPTSLFTGRFDGGGYSVTGLDVDVSAVTYGILTGWYGGLIGRSSGVIENLRFTGSVTALTFVGGLVGYMSGGSVTNAHATGDVSALWYVGGLVGANDIGTTVSNSSASGRVTATGLGAAGGLVGESGSSITASFATGDVFTAATSSQAGGLVGRQISGSITSSYATGNVAGNDTSGGLAGIADGPITSSYALGQVSGDDYVGGLVGYARSAITTSFARGNVTGDSDVGGLLGESLGSAVSFSYATGLVTGASSVGGVVGSSSSSTSRVIFPREDGAWNTGLNPVGTFTGSGAATNSTSASRSALQMESTFTANPPGWPTSGASSISTGCGDALTTTWGVCPTVNDGYPYLVALWSSYTQTVTPGSTSSTFRFQLETGEECTAISPMQVVNGASFTLPSATADCRTPGSELVGWRIPGQTWAFDPGFTVRVSDSQTFTAVLREPIVVITIDANVAAGDGCVGGPRTIDLYLARPTSLTPRGSSAQPALSEFPSPLAAPCTPPGHRLTAWNTSGDGRGLVIPLGTSMGRAVGEDSNAMRLFAVWSPA